MRRKPDPSHPFYDRLSQLIVVKKKAGLGICTVAFYAGVNKNTLINYCQRRSTPDMVHLEKLADYFGVTVDYLLGRGDSSEYHKIR